MSDVRWSGCNKIIRKNYDFVFTGGNKHKYGVGLLIKEKLSNMIGNIIPWSDQVIGVQLDTLPKPVSIIQVDAPTADKEDEDIEKFYEDIEGVRRKLRRDGPVIIMGDYNAKVGKGTVDNVVGAFGLGERNDRGTRLIEFAKKHNMIILSLIHISEPTRPY